MTKPDPNYFTNGPGLDPKPHPKATSMCKCGHSFGAHWQSDGGSCHGRMGGLLGGHHEQRCSCPRFRKRWFPTRWISKPRRKWLR